jgi:hypothetical protein
MPRPRPARSPEPEFSHEIVATCWSCRSDFLREQLVQGLVISGRCPCVVLLVPTTLPLLAELRRASWTRPAAVDMGGGREAVDVEWSFRNGLG